MIWMIWITWWRAREDFPKRLPGYRMRPVVLARTIVCLRLSVLSCCCGHCLLLLLFQKIEIALLFVCRASNEQRANFSYFIYFLFFSFSLFSIFVYIFTSILHFAPMPLSNSWFLIPTFQNIRPPQTNNNIHSFFWLVTLPLVSLLLPSVFFLFPLFWFY